MLRGLELDRFLCGSLIHQMAGISTDFRFLEFLGSSSAGYHVTWTKLIPIFPCSNLILEMNKISDSFWKNIFPMPMAHFCRCRRPFLNTHPIFILSSVNCQISLDRG